MGDSRRAGTPATDRQTRLYHDAVAQLGAALARLARSYEADPDKREDLVQEIHFRLWRSFAVFDGRCSLRTWVYRVAHNVAASHIIDARRRQSRMLVGLDELEAEAMGIEPESGRGLLLTQLMALVERLQPLDREIVVLYLEGLDAAEIGEIAGLSPGNVSTRVSRIKKLLARYAGEGRTHVT